MNEKSCKIEINGKKFQMVYTASAMLEIMHKYGDVEGMADKAQANKAESAEIVPWLIAILCNQGIKLENENTKNKTDLLTPEWVSLHTMPKEWKFLMGECMKAIAIGNGTYHETKENEEVDVVLEEIEKNVETAGA